MKASEAIATRSRRNLRQNSASGERAAISPPISRYSSPSCAPAGPGYEVSRADAHLGRLPRAS